jgi:hypothetical protein
MERIIRELLAVLYTARRVYPEMADGKVITGAGAWALGSFVDVFPANTLSAAKVNSSATMFRILGIEVVACGTTTDTYQLSLYSGASGSEVLLGTVTYIGTFVGRIDFYTDAIDLTSRISAKLATKAGSNHTTTIYLSYVEV